MGFKNMKEFYSMAWEGESVVFFHDEKKERRLVKLTLKDRPEPIIVGINKEGVGYYPVFTNVMFGGQRYFGFYEWTLKNTAEVKFVRLIHDNKLYHIPRSKIWELKVHTNTHINLAARFFVKIKDVEEYIIKDFSG